MILILSTAYVWSGGMFCAWLCRGEYYGVDGRGYGLLGRVIV